jgi:N,N'-diacetyllegionaminate synthase
MTTTWLHDPARGRPCTIIGEVAQAHDGSLGTAHAYIDAIADAGADAVKFQTHIADAESTPGEPWRVRFSPQDESRYDYWKRMEFSEAQWSALRVHADERGLLFLSSPFSLQAIELLERVGVAGWKVASGEVSDPTALEAMARTGLPILMSTGMSPLDEIDGLVESLRGRGGPLALMQCASMYPTPPEDVGLNVLGEFRERYGCAVGLSDHSATIFPGLAGATLGIELLEVHVALSRDSFGPDVVASLLPDELAELVRGVRFIETMKASPVDKTRVPDDIAPLRDLFMKSVYAGRNLAAGTRLTREDLVAKKPGGGIPARELEGLVGRVLRRGVERDEKLGVDDLED